MPEPTTTTMMELQRQDLSMVYSSRFRFQRLSTDGCHQRFVLLDMLFRVTSHVAGQNVDEGEYLAR